jgi:hypothetical protein
MDAINLISQDLFDKVRSRYSNLEMGDEDGNVTSDPQEARFFDFDYTVEGTNIGRVSISINERGSLKVFYGQGILEGSDPLTQEMWFDFLREMRNFAKRRLMRFDTRDITKSNLDKTDFQYLASTGSKEENMSESKMYGSSKSSYQLLEKTKLIIRHSKAVDEEQRGARSRNVGAIYIENAEGERFKYPFIHIAGAKAMQRHVANGGRPYDECGNAIIKMSEDIAKLGAFKRHVGKHDSMHQDANAIMEKTNAKLESLRHQVGCLCKQGHYESWKEAFAPVTDEVMMDQATMEDYKAKFTVSTFAEDLTEYFPLVYAIMQEAGEVDLESYVEEATDTVEKDAEGKVKSWSHEGDWEKINGKDPKVSGPGKAHHLSDLARRKSEKTAGKTFEKFEEWADDVTEGRLTDDEIANLKDLLDSGLTLGVDGTNAIESLQGLGIDDPALISALEELAKVNPEADPTPTIGAWLSKNDPDAAHALGMEHEQPAAPEAAPAPEEAPAEEAVGDDHANKAKKLAQAGQKPKEPNLSVGQKLKSIVKGATAWVNNKPDMDSDLDLDEEGEGEEMPQEEVSLHDIAEMVKSFYDRETKKFPLGKTGVVTKVRKEMGDNAAQLAERLVDHLEATCDEEQQNDMAVEPHDSISPVHGGQDEDPSQHDRGWFGNADVEQEAFEEFMQAEAYDQLDELSKKTLASYAKKASSSSEKNSNSSLSSKAGYKLGKSHEADIYGMKSSEGDDDGTKDDRKSFQRSKGIGRAIDRLTKEEVELGEECEILSELSKKTLGSYVKAAAQDAEQSGREQEHYGDQSDYDRGAKRQKGIAKAVDKLTKEEVEDILRLSGLKK